MVVVPDDISVDRGEVSPVVIAGMLKIRGEPVVTAPEVARVVNRPVSEVVDELNKLERAGNLSSRTMPCGENVWWVSRG